MLKVFKWFKSFNWIVKCMGDIYKYAEECSPNKKWKILIAFDNMIAGMCYQQYMYCWIIY